MDIGAKRNPVKATMPLPQRPEPPFASAAKPELPPDRTVQPGRQSDAVRPDGEDRARTAREGLAAAVASRLRETMSRIRRDEQADEWVFSQVDAATGEVLAQFPDDATLRRRAFLEGLDRAGLDHAGERHLVTKIA